MMNGERTTLRLPASFALQNSLSKRQLATRPSIIVQGDAFNQTEMHTTVVIPMTTNLRLADFPGNMLLSAEETGLPKDSVAVTPQITAIDKARLVERVSVLPRRTMQECAENIKLVLNIE